MRARSLCLGALIVLLQACSSSTDDGSKASAGGGGGAGGAAAGASGAGQSGAGASGAAGSGQPGAGQAGSSGSGQAGQGGAGAAGSGQSGAGGSSGQQAGGSSGSGGAPPPFQPSQELQRLLDEIAKLKAGQPADLDGDGSPDSKRTVADDGSITVEYDQDGDGNVDFLLQSDGKGKITMTVDSDSSGVPEIEVVQEATKDSEKVVRTDDTNLDGTMDRRQTWLVQASTAAAQAYTDEVDTDADGTYDKTTNAQLTKTKNAGDCEGSDNFPEGGTDYSVIGGSVSVKTGSGAGECWGNDASSIAAAVDCALSKGALCLANTNTQEYSSLMAAVYGDSRMPLKIGCGNICSGTIASTRGWSAPWFSDSTMNINTAEWNKLDSDGKCNVMLHEMMHWAGDEGSSDHNSEMGPGDDKVYSCGRYCGRCSDAGHGSPHNSAVDCAKCADTGKRKEQCGLKKMYKELPCAGALGGLCHAGLACIAADCETCGGYQNETCDGSNVFGEATCCASCPSSCNKSNDLPCNGSQMDSDTCTDSNPPFCKK